MRPGRIVIELRKLSRGSIYLVATGLVLLVIALHWAKPGFIIGQSDINLSDHIWNQFWQCTSSWSYAQSYLGQTSWCFSYSPVLLVHATLAAVFGDSYGESLSLILPYLIALPGAYLAARTLGASDVASSATAFAYVFNPYTQVIVGLNTAVPIFTATFAWICALVVIAAKEPTRRFLCALGLCAIFSFAVCLFAIMPHLLVDLSLGLLLWCIVAMYICGDRSRFMRWIALLIPVLFIVSIWWLVPTVIALGSNQNYRPTNVASNAWTFARATLWNSLRFNPVWLWGDLIYFPEAPSYDSNPLTYGSGIFLACGLVGALARCRGRVLKISAILGLSALLLLFLGKGPQAPLGALTTFVMTLPILFVFQDPAGLTIIASFFLAVTLGFCFSSFEGSWAGVVVRLCFVLAALSSTLLFIDGSIFHGNSDVGISMYAKEPDYWLRLQNVLDSDTSAGDGVLFTPADEQYDATYTWDYVGADTVPISLTMRRALVLGPPFGYFVTKDRTDIYNSIDNLLEAGSPVAKPLIRDLGIRYVVYRHDIIEDTPFPRDAEIARALAGARERRLGALSIWDLGPARPLITDWTASRTGHPHLDAGSFLKANALMQRYDPLTPWTANEPRTTREFALKGTTTLNENAIAVKAGSAHPSTVAIRSRSAFVARVVSTMPTTAPFFSYQSPFIIAGDDIARVPSAVSVPVLLLDRNRHQPFWMFNPSNTVMTDTVIAFCHGCPRARAAHLTIGRSVYGAYGHEQPDGTVMLRFGHVRWLPGITYMSIQADDPNAAIRGWDVYFDDASVRPIVLGDITAFYPVNVRLYDKPAFADLQLPVTHELPPGLVLYIRSDKRTISCYTVFGGDMSFDVFPDAVGCLRQHGMRTDPRALVDYRLVGIGLYEKDATTRSLRRLNVKSRAVVHWDPAWYQVLDTHQDENRAHGSKWSVAGGLRSGDIIDAYIGSARAGTFALLSGGATIMRRSMQQVSGGVAVGFRNATTTHVDAIAITSPYNTTSATLTIWRRTDHWTISTGSRATVGMVGSGIPSIVNVPPGSNTTLVPGSPTTMITLSKPARIEPADGCSPAIYSLIYSCRARAKSVVVLNVAFNPLWLAFENGHPIPHAKVDGWRNGWMVEKSGTIFMGNALNALPIALLILTICAFAPLSALLRRVS